MPFFSKKKYLLSIAIISSYLFAGDASALQVGNMWYIGDSLSDQGNCDVPFFPPPPLTNGNTYAFYLGQKFGKTIVASSRGGTDFACVGASTGYPSTFFPTIIKSGSQQIDELLSTNPHFGSHDLFIYWLGANDILLAPPVDVTVPDYPPFNATQSVNFVQQGLTRLHAAGARYLVVLNLPPLEKTPDGMDPTNTPAQNAGYFNGPRAFNAELLLRLNSLGLNIIQIDLFSIFNALISNPQPFGITNTTVGCTQPGGQSCETSFFWDGVHPTDKVHRMLADALFSILTAPDFYATLAQVPFSLLEAENTTIRQQLYPQQPEREIGKIYPFFGGDVNFFNSPAISSDRMTFKSNSGAATVGILSQINDEWLVGAAVGQAVTRMNYGNFDSGFRLNATILSLFGSYQKEKFYVNGVLNYARLHYYDIERQFNIGPVLFTSDGETYGNQAGASFATGYNFINRDDLQLGPIATLSYQYLGVNGYTETGGDVFDIVYDDQKNSSVVGSLGLQATFKKFVNCIPITTNIFATLNHQFSGGERDIFFHQASLAANFASLPVLEPKYSYASGGINIAAELKHGITASIGYFATIGEYGSHSNLVAVGLTAAL